MKLYYYFMVSLIILYAVVHITYIHKEYETERRFIQWHILVMLSIMALIFFVLSAIYPTLTGQQFNHMKYISNYNRL